MVDAITTRTVSIAFNDRSFAGWRSVLHRPIFRFDKCNVARLRASLKQCGDPFVAPPLALIIPAPDGLPFVEVAVAAAAPPNHSRLR